MAIYVVPDKNAASDMSKITEYPTSANKLFTLEYNELDGTFTPMPDSGYPGWWGGTPTDSSTGVPVDGQVQVQYTSNNRCGDLPNWTLSSGTATLDTDGSGAATVLGFDALAMVSPLMQVSSTAAAVVFSVDLRSEDGTPGYSITIQRRTSTGTTIGAAIPFTGSMPTDGWGRVVCSFTPTAQTATIVVTIRSVSGTTSEFFRVRRPMVLTRTALMLASEGNPLLYEAFMGTLPALPVSPFGTPRTMNAFCVIGDPGLGHYPTDVEIITYNHGEVLHTYSVTGSTDSRQLVVYPSSLSVSHIVVNIQKLSAPGMTMKLQFMADAFIMTREDTLNPIIEEDTEQMVSLARPDSLQALLMGASAVSNLIATGDSLLAKTLDWSLLPYVERYATDTGIIKGNVTSALTNSFTRTDTFLPTVVDHKDITTQLNRGDSIIPRGNIEAEIFTAYLNQPENLVVALGEQKQLFNIYNSMTADQRYILGRVEITYTDPFADETLHITTSEPGTGETALYNNIIDTPYKTMSMHRNLLDGSYHPRDAADPYGWWGTQLSDSEGAFATPVVVTLNFSLRTVASLRISGDSALLEFPVDFDYSVVDAEGTPMHTEVVTDNTEVHWQRAITPIPLAAGVTLTIYKISEPNAVAKLAEMFTMIVQVYEADNIESIHLIDEIGYANGSLPIGNISANEVDIILDNQDRRFDPTNKLSPLYGFVKRNRRIRVWFGAYVDTVLEWTLMGTYWSVSWDVANSALSATVVGRDRLELLRQVEYNTSVVQSNVNMYQAFYDLFMAAGLTEDDFEIDNTLASLTIPHTWYERTKFRDALQHLAGCDVIQVYCTKEGKVRVNWDLDATPTVMARYDEDTNIFSTKHPLAVGEQVNSISVNYTGYTVTLDDIQVLHEYTTPVTILAGNTLVLDITFSQTPVVTVTSTELTADAGIAILSRADYAWGSSIVLQNTAGSSAAVTKIIFNGIALQKGEQLSVTAEDALSIKDNGRMQVTVDHEFIQTREQAQSLADRILAAYKEGRQDIVMSDRGNVAVRLGDRIEVMENGELSTYAVTRQDITWDGALSGSTEGKFLI
jgi:hypothetical protein